MASDYLTLVKQVAGELNLIDDQGKVLPLDSLSMIDLVIALESSAGIAIPATSLRPEAFASVESIAELMAQTAANPT
jgi:acyl carrier protein